MSKKGCGALRGFPAFFFGKKMENLVYGQGSRCSLRIRNCSLRTAVLQE